MLVVRPENVKQVLDIFTRWDVTAVAVGHSIQEPFIRIQWKEEMVGELDLRFQVGGPQYERPRQEPASGERPDPQWALPDLEKSLLHLLTSPNVCSSATPANS